MRARPSRCIVPVVPSVNHTIEHGMFVRRYEAGVDDRTLVWIHGLGESGLCFERIVTTAPLDRFRHIVPDCPGYGRSAWPSRPLTLEATAAILAKLIEKESQPVTLVGHSLGGVLAMLVARAIPSAIALVVDVDGNKSIDDCTYSREAESVALDVFESTVFPAMIDRIYTNGVSDPASRGYYAGLRLCHVATFYAHARELVALSRTESLARDLAALPVQTVFVAGAPGGATERSLQLLEEAGARVLKVEPAGHWPFIDQPNDFAGLLSSLVTEA